MRQLDDRIVAFAYGLRVLIRLVRTQNVTLLAFLLLDQVLVRTATQMLTCVVCSHTRENVLAKVLIINRGALISRHFGISQWFFPFRISRLYDKISVYSRRSVLSERLIIGSLNESRDTIQRFLAQILRE